MSGDPTQSMVRDWLYPILLAIIGPASAIIATYLTNRSADRRFHDELGAKIYESLLSERRESLARINEIMTRSHFDLNDLANAASVGQQTTTACQQATEAADSFRNEVVRSVWLDSDMSRSLNDVLASFRRFQSAICQSQRLVSGDWDSFMKSYAKARDVLKQALGVPKVDNYLKRLYEG